MFEPSRACCQDAEAIVEFAVVQTAGVSEAIPTENDLIAAFGAGRGPARCDQLNLKSKFFWKRT